MPIGSFCFVCEAEREANARFCRKCGTEFPIQPAILPMSEPAKASGRKRVVSVAALIGIALLASIAWIAVASLGRSQPDWLLLSEAGPSAFSDLYFVEAGDNQSAEVRIARDVRIQAISTREGTP